VYIYDELSVIVPDKIGNEIEFRTEEVDIDPGGS
jgi:hypothetical protein